MKYPNAYSGVKKIFCPNCGAPIKMLGTKVCPYCGTGITELNIRVWRINGTKEFGN